MKKLIIILLLLSAVSAQAQRRGRNEHVFNHLSLGVNLGTTGIGVEVGAPLGPIVSFRGGADFFPAFSVTKQINYKRPSVLNNVPPALMEERYVNIPEYGAEVDVVGKPSLCQGKILFDIYTSRDTRFHFTVGTYFSDNIMATLKAKDKTIAAVELYNQDIKDGIIKPEPNYPDGIQLKLEGYPLTLDKGRAEVDLTYNKVRPYFGIGWGRVIPRKAINCTFDLGVSYHGTPKLIDKYKKEHDGRDYEITKDDPRITSDFSDVIGYIQKVPVSLTLKVTLRGKLF